MLVNANRFTVSNHKILVMEFKRENFKEGSIDQLIFDHWDLRTTESQFENQLMELPKEDLVEFITSAQSRGWFSGHCHE